MKTLEKVVAGLVLGAAVLTPVNIKSYLDARKEVMTKIQRETGYEPLVLNGRIVDMNHCEKIAEPYRQELRYEDFGDVVFGTGRYYLLREYIDDCKSADNVGVI